MALFLVPPVKLSKGSPYLIELARLLIGMKSPPVRYSGTISRQVKNHVLGWRRRSDRGDIIDC